MLQEFFEINGFGFLLLNYWFGKVSQMINEAERVL